MVKTRLTAAAAVLAAFAAFADRPFMTPGPGMGYATDAYPGFDSEDRILPREKKTPAFFSWWSGLESDTAAGQAAAARAHEIAGEWKKARKAWDALVAQWPASDEAPAAQLAVADISRERLEDWQDAFDEYKYLADFYSSLCDYGAAVEGMYEMAKKMREEGKTIVFFRFANTTDVRRAFEAVVKRAPGAKFAPAAMMAVAELREEDLDWENAVKVLENIRAKYPRSPEAKASLLREARDRMTIIEKHGYNRARCVDTLGYLEMAVSMAEPEERETLAAWSREVSALVEEEAWEAAKFYDSRTRTLGSAIAAYKRFLSEYPAGRRAPEARERLEALERRRGETQAAAAERGRGADASGEAKGDGKKND